MVHWSFWAKVRSANEIMKKGGAPRLSILRQAGCRVENFEKVPTRTGLSDEGVVTSLKGGDSQSARIQATLSPSVG